jgi:xanthine dehydrogenase accessory factor
MAVRLGFTVHVIDDRSEYANADRFPAPVSPVVGEIAGTLAKWPIDSGTYIVVVTRGHKHDEQALAAVLDSSARYIGMIGSKRKVKVIFDDLLHGGASKERLARVHAPVGLDIGAVTVEEIAVSITAQLIAVRRSERHKAVEGPFPIADAAS